MQDAILQDITVVIERIVKDRMENKGIIEGEDEEKDNDRSIMCDSVESTKAILSETGKAGGESTIDPVTDSIPERIGDSIGPGAL